MELYGRIQCVTYDELVGSGIISKPSYKKNVRSGTINVVRRACRGREALIDFVSLPSDLKKAYQDSHPDAEKELIKQYMSYTIQADDNAVRFYRAYQPAITIERQQEYVLTAQVLNEMVRVEKAMKAEHKMLGNYLPGQTWNLVRGACENLRNAYKHDLPKSESRLRQKFNAYKREGYASLVNKNMGNQVTRKIFGEEARLILKLRRSKFPIYNESQLYEEYNRQAVVRNLKIIKSPTTLRNFLFDPAIMPMWYGCVHGMQAWKAKYATIQKTSLPQMRDALWYGDGTKLNLYYKNEAGKMCTTSVYEIVDAYSETLIGFDVAANESFDSQYRAYRMAIDTAGHKPFEIVTDNQGGHSKLAAQGFFDKICLLHKPTMPYNGQSKTIEAVFGRFQQQVLHKIWHFTGQNITAKKLNSKPNMEFIEENAYALPTLDEVIEIYRQCRGEWNGMAHPATGMARIEMYRMSENPETPIVTELDKVQMFWLTSKNTNTYTNQGITIEIAKKKYHYDVYGRDGLRDDSWAIRNTGRKFRIMYDPMDMTHVELLEPTASGLKFSAVATPKVSISRATQERTSEESSFMRRTIERSKELMAAIQLDGERFDVDERIAAELYGLSTPRPKNVSRKKMEEAREKFDRGELKSPLQLPHKDEDVVTVDYSTTGEYTKAVSNMTYDDLYDKF
ncbi:MAG: hypothetical protein WCS17_04045 [Prevotella sp.]